MNLIKWLKINSDIKLGKLKIEIKKDDVVVIKTSDRDINYADRKFMEQLKEVFPDNLIIFISKKITLDRLNEEEMGEHGWYRR